MANEALLEALMQAGGNPNLQDLQSMENIPPQALLDAVISQGANFAGLPMDMAWLAQSGLDRLGVPNPYPIGELKDIPMSSDWIAEKGGMDINSPQYLFNSVLSASPAGLVKLGAAAPAIAKAVSSGADQFGDLIQAMTVFHGSPHKWDKVDMSKVGTG
ncbi:unnamed protein product, partial [marine sediment metagenome]